LLIFPSHECISAINPIHQSKPRLIVIHIRDNLNTSSEVFKMLLIKIVVARFATPYSLWADTEASVEHTATIFRQNIPTKR
jgi:hypothetical protein